MVIYAVIRILMAMKTHATFAAYKKRIKMKKILILSSSPRRGGNSDRLCDEFLRGATEAGHNAEKIFLRDKTIGYCSGCGVCNSGKSCPQKDDAAEIIAAMISADVIVMATPVYFYTMSAQMKTLIDRCCGRYTEMNDKKFYFIATAADGNRKNMLRTIDTFQGFLDCLNNPTIGGTLLATGVWHAGDVEHKPAMKEAYLMGKNL